MKVDYYEIENYEVVIKMKRKGIYFQEKHKFYTEEEALYFIEKNFKVDTWVDYTILKISHAIF